MELPKPPQPSAPARLKVGWERFPNIIHELRYLSARQQAEVGGDYQPYAPDWDRYLALDRAGSCAVWTARTLALEGGGAHLPGYESEHKMLPARGTLVGYVIWMTTRGLHCVETIFANADLVYLAPDYREGLTGYKLLKTAIAAIKPNVDLIRVETNDLYEDGRMGVLLKRLNFRRIGSVWQGHGQL